MINLFSFITYKICNLIRFYIFCIIFLHYPLIFMIFPNIAFIDFLKFRLKRELPGLNSQLKMAMKVNQKLFRKFIPTSDAKKSSVLILLTGKENLQLVLTLRSKTLKHHNNQISFPGGRNEKDESSVKAAIRETFEEINISINEQQILGSLTEFFVPPSNSLITPIIAYIEKIDGLKANPDEVEEIFFVDLHKFLDDNIIKNTNINVDGYDVKAPYWDVHPKVPLWGATSMIISELIDLYKEWLYINKY